MHPLNKIALPLFLLLLLYGFWINPNFKTIAAGVSIFLFGMYFLKQGFNDLMGGALKKLLAKSTNKLWKSIIFGFFSTALLQSSALISVISISFVSAGLITLLAAVGIIFGANLGTTSGAWLVAGFGLKVKISAYAMPLIVVGLVLTFQKTKQIKGLGFALSGLGFLFLGIHFMREGFEIFREQIDLAEYAIPGLKGLLIYTLAGMVITIIMQSSNAMMVLIITALSLHQVTYENAIALAIGANIGTTLTAILGSLNANYLGKQLALAHFSFNTLTGIIAMLGIHHITEFVNIVSAYLGIAADNYTLKLAVFHTSFNLMGILLLTPFIKKLVQFLEAVIKPNHRNMSDTRYLNESSLEYPETLLQSLRNETIHLYNNISKLLIRTLHVDKSILESENLKKDIKNSQQIVTVSFDETYQHSIKPLIAALIDYSGRGQSVISKNEQSQLFDLRLASIKLSESVKAIEGLRRNMKRYVNAENPAVRNEYNKMRLLILSVLKELDTLEVEQHYDSSVFVSLEEIRIQIKKYRKETNARLDKLIREGKIDPVTASSIQNDRTFTRDAAKRLLDAGKILFSTQDQDMKTAEEILLLSEEEIEDIANSETDS